MENIIVLKIKTANETIREHRLIEVFAILEEYESLTLALKTEKTSVEAVLKQSSQAEALEAKLSEITPVTKVVKRGIISLIGCNVAEEEKLKEQVANVLSTEPELLIFNRKKGVLNIILENDLIVPSVKSLHQVFFE